ncbi:MAG: hypothetical protein ACK4FP_05105 [Azonexus sp.]
MDVRFVAPHISHSVSGLIGPPLGGRLAGVATTVKDTQDGGTFKVQGTVAIDATPDIPVKRKVRLFCLQSGRLVREAWSDPVTGAYRFEYVRQGPWLVVSHDYTGSYNAVVADNILGESM